ncbi:MAG: TniQ family protein [Solirubrobacteraceae bacterium]
MRTLPLRLSPLDGESLPGYIARYAHTFEFQPGDVIRALGLDQGTVAAAGRYGVSLSATQLRHAAFATGIRTEMLEGMLLARYAGLAFDRSAAGSPIPLASAGYRHEVLIRCSRFCPRCLLEDGAWRLRWQLGWSVVCSSHQVLLLRCCGMCEGVPRVGPRERWPQDHRGVLSDPSRCSRRHMGALCRANLVAAEAVSVAGDTQLLGAQRRIDALLNGQAQPTLAGVELEPPIYLRDLIALCNLLDRHARLPEQTQPPAHLRGRRLQDHPAELAGVLAEALALVDLPDQAALADALRELADRRYRADGQTLVAGRFGAVSATLHGALRRALTQTVWARASSRMGFHPHAHDRPDDLDDRLRAHHVPQLFWAEDYQRELAKLFDFDDFTHWFARRFCSALLARMLKALDWHGALRYLDFPDRFVNDRYHRIFTAMGANGRLVELASRVKRIANQHAQHQLVDYKQRRVLLADWDGIDIDTWHLLQPRPRPIYPRRQRDTPVRRAHASVWLWCEITSGHERAAPVRLPTHNLAHHTYFIRDTLPALRERLLILAELLLATPAEARSTLPNRLAVALHRRGYLAENYYLDTIDPLITSRVLAHTSAHTGVDIPSLTTPSPGSNAPPAVTHARALAARLLRHTALASPASVAATIGGAANGISQSDREYRAALNKTPCLTAELDHLAAAIENWQLPTPMHPTAPHQERMHHLATAIKTNSAKLLTPAHGPNIARHASIVVCREHTDLTNHEISTIHNVNHAQPTLARATVERHRRKDPDFERRYRELLDHAHELQRQAGYTHANLKRGPTRWRPTPDAATSTPTTRRNTASIQTPTPLKPPSS